MFSIADEFYDTDIADPTNSHHYGDGRCQRHLAPRSRASITSLTSLRSQLSQDVDYNQSYKTGSGFHRNNPTYHSQIYPSRGKYNNSRSNHPSSYANHFSFHSNQPHSDKNYQNSQGSRNSYMSNHSNPSCLRRNPSCSPSMNNLAEKCKGCGFSVSVDRVSIKKEIYHIGCFKCAR